MIDALARLTTRRPARILVIAVLVSIVSLAVSSGLPGRLATQGFIDENAESQKALEAIADATGYFATEDILAVVTAPGGAKIRSAEGRRAVADTAERLRELDGVVSTSTPFGNGEEPARAGPGSISSDGRSAIVRARTAPHSADADVAANAIDEFENQKNVRLGGALVAEHYVSSTVAEDLKRSEMIAFPLLFLISLFVFRSLLAAALPLLIGAITIPLTMAMISFYNELTSLSVFALNLTTGLGLGLAIDYALLTITRYREELALGAEPPDALRTTMQTAGRTIAFSATTVAGAILVLAIFPLKFLYSMALAGSTVAIASAAVTLTVLPAALYLLGPRIDRYSLARKPIDSTTARWRKLASAVMKRPLMVAGFVTVVIVVLMLPIRNVAFTSVDSTVLPKTNQAHVVHDVLDRDFPESDSSTVMVQVDATPTSKAPAKLRNSLLKVKDVEDATSPIYVGLNTWTFDVQTRELFYAGSALKAVENIRETPSDAPFRVGGTSAYFVDQRDAIINRIPLALLLILGITFIVLFLMTGSVVLPIKTFVMNLMTLAATFGILTWIFGEGHLEGLLGYTSQNALEMTQPVLIFVMAFALATDYGVFLLGRVKELHDQGLDTRTSVVEGVARTGRVITSAALLFCVAIGAFSLSGIVFVKELGIGTALAVAIDATLIRALLVPSLMALLGDYNWWAPRWMKRLHARFGFSEGPSAELPDAPPASAA
jgi:RND superfamily putative drug exporter